ncbi:DUF4386 family protein [Chloroflexota bacterium]
MGGIAALYSGLAYVVGMVGFLVLVGWPEDPVQQVAIMVDNQAVLYILYLIVYVIWAVFLVVLALALYERLKDGSPAIMQTATAIGLIWATIIIAAGMIFTTGMANVVDLYGKDPAQAATVWLAIDSVFGGLGGSNEVVGALWTLLVSWAALRSGGLPKALNYLGVVVGVAGLISIVPAIATLTIFIFAFGGIVWFIWLGIVMLRGNTSAVAQ